MSWEDYHNCKFHCGHATKHHSKICSECREKMKSGYKPTYRWISGYKARKLVLRKKK